MRPWWYWTRVAGETRWRFHLLLPWSKRARRVRAVRREINRRAAKYREQIKRMMQ